MRHRWLRTGLAMAALALAVAGCGDDDDDPADPAAGDADDDSAFPVTIEAANGLVTVDAQPAAIVSMSATATEMLFAIGAGDQVVAVDSTSDYPTDVPTTDLSAFEPNVEAIAGYEPDLVVASDDINDLVAGLEALDIPVLLAPVAAVIDDTYTQIEQLGAATGHVGEAAELVGQMQTELDEIVADLPELTEPLTYYHELDDTFFSVTSATFIGQIYDLAGLRNIADEAEGGVDALYPQLSAEFIIAADPDMIFLADAECCGITADALAQRPGWADLTALQNGGGGVVELDEDISSRWGPRIVDFLQTISDTVNQVSVAG
ncbi:MAG: ABC transporter substrate-binding protein [Acidimicrobiales bacterium]